MNHSAWTAPIFEPFCEDGSGLAASGKSPVSTHPHERVFSCLKFLSRVNGNLVPCQRKS